jgi:hypothetical protein
MTKYNPKTMHRSIFRDSIGGAQAELEVITFAPDRPARFKMTIEFDARPDIDIEELEDMPRRAVRAIVFKGGYNKEGEK